MTKFFKKIYVTLMAVFMSLTLANTVSAQKHESRSIDDLVWVEGGPGLHFALLWGDWTKGNYGMVVKIEAGHAAPKHSHTSDYHGVTIQGTWVHTFEENDDRTLMPGSYAFQSGKEDHGDRCEGPQDCLILIHQHGPRDFKLPGQG
ncbi:MAG: cupin domain-containing protein [Hyphomicrobiaceae bacterium]